MVQRLNRTEIVGKANLKYILDMLEIYFSSCSATCHLHSVGTDAQT